MGRESEKKEVEEGNELDNPEGGDNELSLSLFIHQRGSHLPSDCLIIKDTEGYERGGRRKGVMGGNKSGRRRLLEKPRLYISTEYWRGKVCIQRSSKQ